MLNINKTAHDFSVWVLVAIVRYIYQVLMINYYWWLSFWLYLYLAIHISYGNYCYSGHNFIGSLTLCDLNSINTEILKFFSFQILQIFDAEPSFQENYKDMIKVLESIGKRMITDQNDSFALKVHYLSYLIQQSHDQGMQALMKRWDISLRCSVLVCILCVLFIHKGCFMSVMMVKL